jgi:hypothetical protein
MTDSAENIPPVISPRRRISPHVQLFLGTIAAIIFARFFLEWRLPFLRCNFKNLTGLPCPTCGTTRCLSALAHFHLAEAFWFNPLILISVFVIAFWFMASLLLPAPIFERFKSSLSLLPLLKIGVALLILNWIYLLRFLP